MITVHIFNSYNMSKDEFVKMLFGDETLDLECEATIKGERKTMREWRNDNDIGVKIYGKGIEYTIKDEEFFKETGLTPIDFLTKWYSNGWSKENENLYYRALFLKWGKQ